MDNFLYVNWDNYKNSFVDALTELREQEEFSDATLACEGKFYKVHKIVLSTCSEYFRDIFKITPCKNPVIVLKDINCKDLESLLDYMYTGSAYIKKTDMMSLIEAAGCLNVKGLAIPEYTQEPKRKRRKVNSTLKTLLEDVKNEPKNNPFVNTVHSIADHSKPTAALQSTIQRSIKSPTPFSNSVETSTKQQPPLINHVQTFHKSTESLLSNVESFNKPPAVLPQNYVQESSKMYEDVPINYNDDKNEMYNASVNYPEVSSKQFENVPLSYTDLSGKPYENVPLTQNDGGYCGLNEEMPITASQDVKDSENVSGEVGIQHSFLKQDITFHEQKYNQQEPTFQLDGFAKAFEQSVLMNNPSSSYEMTNPAMLEQALLEEQSVGTVQYSSLNMANTSSIISNASPTVDNTSPMMANTSMEESENRRKQSKNGTPIKCPFCPVSISTPNQLKYHIRKHTGEKPFLCPFCPFRCGYKNNAKIHIIRKHPGQSGIPIVQWKDSD